MRLMVLRHGVLNDGMAPAWLDDGMAPAVVNWYPGARRTRLLGSAHDKRQQKAHKPLSWPF